MISLEQFHAALKAATGIDNIEFTKYVIRNRPDYVDKTIEIVKLAEEIDSEVRKRPDDGKTPVERGREYLEKYKHLLEEKEKTA